jgi:hypothetical protein
VREQLVAKPMIFQARNEKLSIGEDL